MSLQVAIMKVLSGHPGGSATLADMNADLAILNAVPDWTSRMRRLALRRPDLDIFSEKIVVRDHAGWTLTAEGFQVLESLERLDVEDLYEESRKPASVPVSIEKSSDAPPLPRIRPPKHAARLARTSRTRRRNRALDRSA